MAKRIGMICPHCKKRAQVRASYELTPTMRELYFNCSSLTCGHTWVAVLEAIRTITPAGLPDPLIDLPVMRRPEVKKLFDKLKSKKD